MILLIESLSLSLTYKDHTKREEEAKIYSQKSNTTMWLSKNEQRNLWIVGGILLMVSFLIIILRKWAMNLAHWATTKEQTESCSKKNNTTSKEDHRVGNGKNITTNWRSLYGNKKNGDPIIRTYALEELRSATRDFRYRIGVGATSFVYVAELGEGKFGAVKRVMEERGGSNKMFLDEVSVLLRISHPNLVGLMGFCLEKGEQLLLLEYVPNKSLFDRMHTYKGQSSSGILTWSNRLSIALDIARALDYLHSQADPPIIHRDVKSSNILLIDDDHAKLADFGLCKLGHNKDHQSKSPTKIKGSFGYVDTNYLKTGQVSPKSDVYSFGVLLLELITGLKSTQGSTPLAEWTEECRKNVDDVEVLVGILDPKLNGNANFEQLRVLIDVVNWALLDNSESRPNMSQIVERISTCMESQLQPELPV